jgi:hypothetical protein
LNTSRITSQSLAKYGANACQNAVVLASGNGVSYCSVPASLGSVFGLSTTTWPSDSA